MIVQLRRLIVYLNTSDTTAAAEFNGRIVQTVLTIF